MAHSRRDWQPRSVVRGIMGSIPEQMGIPVSATGCRTHRFTTDPLTRSKSASQVRLRDRHHACLKVVAP